MDTEYDKLLLAIFLAYKNPPCYVSVVDYINIAINVYSHWVYTAP